MKDDLKREQKTGVRRKEIIDAALSCFAESGYAAATVAEIRRRSGASVGSIYHHFGGKEGLARAVYLDGIRDYQAGLLTVLQNEDDARAGVQAIVRYHLTWVRDRPHRAGFLLRMRHADFMAEASDELSRLNRAFGRGVYGWARKQADAGAIRRLPMDLFISTVFGPCQEFVGLRLAGVAVTDLDTAVTEIGISVWSALKRSSDEG